MSNNQPSVSFKERARQEIITQARNYQHYYVEYDYLLCSSAFARQPFYIIQAHEDNYLHLTGVHSTLSANQFFCKCIDGSLSLSDFDFCKRGQTEAVVKNSVRRKIQSLGTMMALLNDAVQVEEDFEKNQIKCAFAAGTSACTVGFYADRNARPRTLLKGYELNAAKAAHLSILLRKKRESPKFDTVLVCAPDAAAAYESMLDPYITEACRAYLYPKTAAAV